MTVVYGDLLDKCIFFNICRPTLLVRSQLFLSALLHVCSCLPFELGMTKVVILYDRRQKGPKPNRKPRFFLQNLPKPTGKIFETVTILVLGVFLAKTLQQQQQITLDRSLRSTSVDTVPTFHYFTNTFSQFSQVITKQPVLRIVSISTGADPKALVMVRGGKGVVRPEAPKLKSQTT